VKEYAYGMASGLLLAAFVWWWAAGAPVAETPAAAVRQSDGSLVLERKPDAKARPVAQIPKRAKLERQIRVEVQPARADCPVCVVDLSLVRLPDDTRRVIASSPTGDVIAGLDVPVAPIQAYKKWLAGALYNGRWGGLVGRNIGPLMIGGALTNPRAGSVEAWGIIAVRF
jgi:hypothetical protein